MLDQLPVRLGIIIFACGQLVVHAVETLFHLVHMAVSLPHFLYHGGGVGKFHLLRQIPHGGVGRD